MFHNGKNYDCHLLLAEGFTKMKEWEFNPIAQSAEKYISIKVRIPVAEQETMTLKIIDSCQFLLCSLAKLVAICPKMPLTQSLPLPDIIKNRKGVFPYSYITSQQVLEETKSIPPKECFYDTLTKSDISEVEYEHAKATWKAINCSTLKEYMMVYLKTDVYQLADVFNSFRELALSQDGLDPLNYFGIPGFTWDSAFKMTKAKIDLLSDLDMLEMFERGIRGGCSFVNEHFCEKDDQNEMLYLDVNNLYGEALSMKLPVSGFRWCDDPTKILETLPNIDDDGDVGYLLEVDITIPDSLHDYLDDFPLAPEHLTVSTGVKKLIMSHHPKKKYVIHFALLKKYIALGAVVTKCHRCVQFNQKNVFQEYISFNSQKRQESTSSFEKDYYKLKNNRYLIIFFIYIFEIINN